ncbi:prenyltransferase/squalene oxidase repeat-containing protein [Anatilimnocola sp. NA78]|uniref:prenyltransferase/squalene oxidase repeat-containing protein n=1 Tax=Anatilimnocola sp. NA78 TaxID=3415683 RepID=UPI003CE490D2
MSTQTNQDSELQHSFGPGEIGFDFLPLQTTSAPLPTQPETTIPTFDLQSSSELPSLTDALPVVERPIIAASPNGRGQTRFWLDGETILCSCPDCKAPMSVRLWLMTADCWRCGVSIDLTEEQEREISKLLEARKPAPAKVPPPAPKAAVVAPTVAAAVVAAPVLRAPVPPPKITPPPLPSPSAVPQPMGRASAPVGPVGKVSAPVPPPAPTKIIPPPVRQLDPATTSTIVAPPAPPVPQRRPVTPPPAPQPAKSSPAATQQRQVQQRRPAPVPVKEVDWIKKFVDATPAWMISGLVHLIALTLLAMFTVPEDDKEGPTILLSANLSNERVEGGDTLVLPPDVRAQFDMPLPEKVDLKNPDEIKSLVAANQDARELRLDSDDLPNMASVDLVKKQVENATGVRQALSARDPRLRVEMVTQEGGTTMTEAAVARGLRWLANHQNKDGSWRLDDFESVNNCNCGGRGHFHTKAPGTALAMLPFLGAGQTHLAGKYKGSVSRALRWLVQHQKENGDLRHDERSNAGMYTHGQASIVLCEAFAMTGDEELRIPAQKAIDFIVKAQFNDGGWRYQPGPSNDRGDTSVVGWQLMALQSARAANLNVPERTLLRASSYLDTCQSHGGSQYSYMSGSGPTPVMTAEALLCRMYLGWNKKQHPALGRGVDTILAEYPPRKQHPNIYYWYYATQTMHHFGGEQWDEWNLQMRDVLTSTQQTSGHAAGSWEPRGEHADRGGRIYMTSLAVCTLEVYYRHLPIFRQIKLD